MSRFGGVEGSVIGCKARKARARSGGLSCPPNHPRSLPYRDFVTVQTRGMHFDFLLTPRGGWVGDKPVAPGGFL